MLSLVDMRKAALALFMGALLVLAVIPVCQMIACDAMMGAAWSSHSPEPGLAAYCAPPVTGRLSSSGVVGSSWSSTMRVATTLLAFALVAPVLNRDLSLSASRIPSPNCDPLGVRILI